jgi:hypothetical protein
MEQHGQLPGEKFRCANPLCGCEVVVSRSGADAGIKGHQALVCSCGQPMKKGWSRPIWIPSLRRGPGFSVN